MFLISLITLTVFNRNNITRKIVFKNSNLLEKLKVKTFIKLSKCVSSRFYLIQHSYGSTLKSYKISDLI